MKKQTAEDLLILAKKHLETVQASWDPVDWGDLSHYGLYCLEAAIKAAAIKLGWNIKPSHCDKSKVAERLSKEKGLSDIGDLLWTLNNARKSIAYGDVEMPELDPEDIVIQIEDYVEAIESLINQKE
jgi:hypothetical protein